MKKTLWTTALALVALALSVAPALAWNGLEGHYAGLAHSELAPGTLELDFTNRPTVTGYFESHFRGKPVCIAVFDGTETDGLMPHSVSLVGTFTNAVGKCLPKPLKVAIDVEPFGDWQHGDWVLDVPLMGVKYGTIDFQGWN